MSENQSLKMLYDVYIKYINVLFCISATCLTCIMTLNYSVQITYKGYTAKGYEVQPGYAMLAVLIMIPVYIYLAGKGWARENYEKCSGKGLLFCGVTALGVGYQLFIDCQVNYDAFLRSLYINTDSYLWQEVLYHVAIPCISLFCMVAILTMLVYVYNLLAEFFGKAYLQTDKNEKLFFGIGFVVCLSIICFFYSRTSGQINSLDLVYQTDSLFVYEHYYPVFSFGFDFDWDIGNGGIRHPLATLCMFPLHVWVSLISNLLFFIPNVDAVLYAVIQVVVMLITVIFVKRITKSEWIYPFFLCSFPFLLFTVFIEKYQIAVFFLVMFVYAVVQGEENEIQAFSLIGAGGCMITSALHGFFYGKEKKLGKKIKEYFFIFFAFLLVLVAFGRIGYILQFGYLQSHNMEMFYDEPSLRITFYNKLCGFLNLLVACFVPVAYEETKTAFYWAEEMTNSINWFGVVLAVLMLYSIIRFFKRKEVKIMTLWLAWIFVQHVIIGFGTGCDPLFSWHYAWAIVPLILMAAESLLKNLKVRTTVFSCCLLVMVYLNYIHMVDLYYYLLAKTPL